MSTHDKPLPRVRARWSTTRDVLLWSLAALLGIAVTAALTWSVSGLVHQRIGLSSEPPSVVRGLAPPPARSIVRDSGAHHRASEPRRSRSARTAAIPTIPPATPPVASSPPAPPPPPASSNRGSDNRDDSNAGSGAARGQRDD